MIDDEGTPLTELEAARFDDIVGREWPRADLGEAGPQDRSSPPSLQSTGPEPGHITVFQPRRPAPPVALAGLLTLSMTAAASRHFGMAAFAGTVDRTLSAAARIDAAHTVTVICVAAGVGIAASLTVCGAWLVGWAHYRLRRSAWRTALDRTVPGIERHVRPPNIATALAWTGLLVGVTIVAGWWVPNQLDLLATSRSAGLQHHLSEQLIAAGIVWCGIAVASMAGLTVWACREGRHQIRVKANRFHSSP